MIGNLVVMTKYKTSLEFHSIIYYADEGIKF